MRRLLPADRVLLVLFLLIIVYYSTTHGIFQGKASGDGYLGFLYLPGLVFHRSFDLAAVAPEYLSLLGREQTGRVANPCPIGPLLFWMPPYLLGLGIKKAMFVAAAILPRSMAAGLGPPLPLSAHGAYDFFMAGLGSLLAGFIGMERLARVLLRRLPLSATRAAVLCAVLGTPLCWYLVTQPLYQHAISFFAVTLFVERWDAWRAAFTLRRAAALGAIGGYMMLVRVQEGIFLLLPALDLLARLARAARSRLPKELLLVVGQGALLCTIAALCFLPQLLLWRSYFGTLRAPQAPGHMRWGSPALVETLCSMRSGILPWTPLWYLALPGLFLGRRHLGGLAGRFAVLFLMGLYVNAAAWDYHGCWGFGPRRFTDMTVVLAAGIGGLYAACGKRSRPLLGASLAVLCLWNLLLTDLLRQRKIKNSAVGAFPAAQWARWAGGPAWLERALGRFGYPFAWPAAFAYALVYRMPVTQFEGIVGNFLLERDWRVRGIILTPGFAFADAPSYVISGVQAPPAGGFAPDAQVPAGPVVRLLIPLAAREPIRFRLSGDFGGREGQVAVRWNGEALPPDKTPGRGVIAVEVPERLTRTRARLNELVFSQLPPGTRLHRLDFRSFTRWWER